VQDKTLVAEAITNLLEGIPLQDKIFLNEILSSITKEGRKRRQSNVQNPHPPTSLLLRGADSKDTGFFWLHDN